jgi:hypothetical protein
MSFIQWWWWLLRVWDLEMRRRWISVALVAWLFQRRLLPLFVLVKDLDVVLELREPCLLSVYVLPSGFGTLNYDVSVSDSFMFLMEPFNLLLNPSQFCLFHNFIFECFIFPIFNFNLLELCISLDDLNRRRCPWSQLVRGTSVGLGRAGASYILA